MFEFNCLQHWNRQICGRRGRQQRLWLVPEWQVAGAAPTATIQGPDTGLTAPTAIAVDSSGNIYVANADYFSPSILVFSAGSNGNATPSITVSGSNTGLDWPGGIAVDSRANIYVTNDGSTVGNGDSITVYSAGSSGNASPIDTLYPLNLGAPTGILVDSSGNLYVANDASTEAGVDNISVYPAGGQVPIETIGLETGISWPAGIAFDLSGNIYVTNDGSYVGANGNPGGWDSINIYSPGTYGNAPVSNAIIGSNTGLNTPGGIATDPAGNLYVVNSAGGVDGQGSLTVYPAGSTGNVTPSATIAGDSTGDNTGFGYPVGIALDSKGYIYVANPGGGPDQAGSITIYSPGSNGNVAPVATISDNPNCAPCDNTGLSIPYGVAVDFSGKIYVVNSGGGPSGLGSVTIYPALGNSTGVLNESPTATIQAGSTGDNTGLNVASGIALDSMANIYVANEGSLNGDLDSITVYASGSNGNVAPIQTITGADTGLAIPQALALTWNAGALGGSDPAFASPPRHRRKHGR